MSNPIKMVSDVFNERLGKRRKTTAVNKDLYFEALHSPDIDIGRLSLSECLMMSVGCRGKIRSRLSTSPDIPDRHLQQEIPQLVGLRLPMRRTNLTTGKHSAIIWIVRMHLCAPLGKEIGESWQVERRANRKSAH